MGRIWGQFQEIVILLALQDKETIIEINLKITEKNWRIFTSSGDVLIIFSHYSLSTATEDAGTGMCACLAIKLTLLSLCWLPKIKEKAEGSNIFYLSIWRRKGWRISIRCNQENETRGGSRSLSRTRTEQWMMFHIVGSITVALIQVTERIDEPRTFQRLRYP